MLVELDEVMDILIDAGYLKGTEAIPHKKPTHGPCCTCQICGYHHDDCVCLHNELLESLMALAEVK